MVARAFGLAMLAVALAAPPALAARQLHAGIGEAAPRREASGPGKATGYRAKAKPQRSQAHRQGGTRAPRAARSPRLPDAPEELLPAPRITHAFRMEPVAASPRTACLAAARRAERIHGLPDGLLVAIALSESGLHANALNIGGRAHFPESAAEARVLLRTAPRAAPVMAGCVQVNARVHARGMDWPLDAERSADWAGGLLRRWHVESGSWTTALARWHGGSPANARRAICRVRAKLDVASPGSPVLAEARCAGSMARERRNGQALLSVAEMPGS